MPVHPVNSLGFVFLLLMNEDVVVTCCNRVVACFGCLAIFAGDGGLCTKPEKGD